MWRDGTCGDTGAENRSKIRVQTLKIHALAMNGETDEQVLLLLDSWNICYDALVILK